MLGCLEVQGFGIGDSMYDEAMAGLSLFKVPRETYIGGPGVNLCGTLRPDPGFS